MCPHQQVERISNTLRTPAFPTELPLASTKKGGTQASAKEAGNKATLSAILPLRCLPTWVAIIKLKPQPISNLLQQWLPIMFGSTGLDRYNKYASM